MNLVGFVCLQYGHVIQELRHSWRKTMCIWTFSRTFKRQKRKQEMLSIATLQSIKICFIFQFTFILDIFLLFYLSSLHSFLPSRFVCFKYFITNRISAFPFTPLNFIHPWIFKLLYLFLQHVSFHYFITYFSPIL